MLVLLRSSLLLLSSVTASVPLLIIFDAYAVGMTWSSRGRRFVVVVAAVAAGAASCNMNQATLPPEQ